MKKSNAQAMRRSPKKRLIAFSSSVRRELCFLIVAATIAALFLSWGLSALGLNGWIDTPVTIITIFVFTYLFSGALTKPILKMSDAAHAMSQGDYSVRISVNPKSQDEIAQLARSFNEMAQELEHDDQMRRDMIANVSHELRTPVAALQAMVENMADGVVEPTPSNLDNILNQTRRLSNLIAFLLDLSRIEAGAASLQIESFNFAHFIDETVAPLEVADGKHNHTISINVPDAITIEADQDRLQQLFTNIIANALKHSPDNTSILVEAHEDTDNDTVVTNVINFGSHIPSAVRNEIFQRFVKGKSGPGTETGGTGLGLSIARWAAQLHEGSVQVVDDPRGANFEIVLPKHAVIHHEESSED